MSDVALPRIPLSRTRRIIILSDAKNEADDQYAITHAVLSPSLDIRGLVACHYMKPGSMEKSFDEEVRLVRLLRAEDRFPVVHGAEGPLEKLPKGHGTSEGAQLVVREAMSDDERPLYVLALGALTEMAEALAVAPEIAKRLTLVWVGGGAYPSGGSEANLRHDVRAAQEVFASATPLVQITSRGYRRMAVPISQLANRVAPCGELGRYLYEELVEFAELHMAEKPWIMPEYWCLGDNSAVGLLLCPQTERSAALPRPSITAEGFYAGEGAAAGSVRVYESLDARPIIEDLFAKLERFAAVGYRPALAPTPL